MDPIRTAVKYALIPLRIVIQLGEAYVGEEDTQQREDRPAPRRRARPSPQASAKPKDLGDAALARKVETVIFRDDSVPKGDINVNAVDGVVSLRGQAKTPEMIKDLERQTLAIVEVREVENLLHLPKTPARSSNRRPKANRKVTTAAKNGS
jgi:hypothetical protein